jgi:hypothetical protein
MRLRAIFPRLFTIDRSVMKDMAVIASVYTSVIHVEATSNLIASLGKGFVFLFLSLVKKLYSVKAMRNIALRMNMFASYKSREVPL